MRGARSIGNVKKDHDMELKTWTVFDEYYRGLKVNGWPRDEAAKAARRHIDRMRPSEIKKEVARILASRQQP